MVAVSFRIFMYASVHGAMTAYVSVFSQIGPFDLFEKRVSRTRRKKFCTDFSTGVNASSEIVFIFLRERNRRSVTP